MSFLYGQGGQTSVAAPSIAVPGLVLQRAMTKEAINLMGAAAQVITITVGIPAVSTLYTIAVNGGVVSFTTPAAITATELQTLIIDRLSVNPQISGSYRIEAISTTGVRLTALVIGFDGLVSVVGGATSFTNVTSVIASRVAFGRIISGLPEWSDGLQIAGLPVSAANKVLGATQFSHGGVRELNGLDGFFHGDAMSLVVSGVMWMEFNAPVVAPAVGSVLSYRSVKTGDAESGKLAFGLTPPTGYTLLPGLSSLDSETTTIADGRVVGLISLSV